MLPFIFIPLNFHDVIKIMLVMFEIKFLKYPFQISV